MKTTCLSDEACPGGTLIVKLIDNADTGKCDGKEEAMGRIGVVLVSHSEYIALGLRDLVNEMNDGSVSVVAAGGADEGRIGTSAIKIQEAIESVGECDNILIYTDLGSSILSAETALDLMDEDLAGKCRLVDCPFVEGALAGVVMASGTGDVNAAVQASEDVRGVRKL